MGPHPSQGKHSLPSAGFLYNMKPVVKIIGVCFDSYWNILLYTSQPKP